ncbi:MULTISPECIES: NAD(P)-dependent oxidoreductase [Tatumella]|uniref:NAD-dependent epimerase/dehydratase family protein n=1 Tax=Tatumella punctata TaxID=399969 RepID=A0ABW1VSU8_9GAMM|nr:MULTISPECIES: NAD(P)-dependent oxidoreductase [unclassified Tatumella]MBS0878101.1 NAD(P)-dependent oxidoreductase [Tatumella sp. JGM82]MBS0890460.1 NAD(P)-dependent oxidoreductase [Tatumella sp. JGM94]MBS0895152.1 NAD(P)-dependent oxidoreductase [Tatumella sp. JGM130]MBS0900916.1 NAD(P)-dependent oxidoreductase [Tatumella sp. JGM100]
MNRTVALTGGTGFIGRYIVGDLLRRGFRIRALTRTQRSAPDARLSWVHGCLESPQALCELVRGADDVIHCAGQVRGGSENVFTRTNLHGSQALLQAALHSGQCRRFLFISSLAARHPELSWYAASKHRAEQQLQTLAGDISLGIFRPTAVYGCGDKELYPLLNGLLRGVLPCPAGHDGTLSFLHVSDLATAVSQWLLSASPATGIYELCDGMPGGYSWKRLQLIGASVRRGPVWRASIPLTVLRLLAAISVQCHRVTGKAPMLTPAKIREIIHPDWSASNQRLTAAISWRPEVSLERALRERLF